MLIYLLLVAYVVYQLQASWLLLLIEATLLRALLFDPALNTSRSWFNYREGRPWGSAFEVGTTAIGDKVIRWSSNKLGMEPEHLRFLLWLGCMLLIICYLLTFK